MKKKSMMLVAVVGFLAACASPSELRGREVTFAASSTKNNANQVLNCVAAGWQKSAQQPVTINAYENGFTAVAQSKALFGTNTDFVIDSANAKTGGAVFQLWSTMSKESTDKLIGIIQPCL